MHWRIPLADVDIDEEEIQAVTKVLQSKWLTMGEVTHTFERAFADKMSVKHAFAVSNCTAALHLANAVLGVGPGDEVICPALTFVASANATRYTGADVVFADVVSEHDLTIDPVDIRARITDRTKAITVVHYAGFPALMDDICHLAREYNLKIIEDCAHSPFACHLFRDGTRKYVGSIGDLGCFSFFGNKNMTTGEGGMITTNDDDLAAKLKLLRSHGMTTLTYERHKGHATGYDVLMLGYNYRLDEVRSSIGIAQLRKLDRNNQERRNIYGWYADALATNANVVVPFADRPIEQATPHIMPIIIKHDREQLVRRLTASGIQTSKHYDLIPLFSLYKGGTSRSKVASIHNLLTLPMYPGLTKDDVNGIAQLLQY